jgi:hypothetical protein
VDPSYTVTWHLGAVALLTAVGALIGRVLPKWKTTSLPFYGTLDHIVPDGHQNIDWCVA